MKKLLLFIGISLAGLAIAPVVKAPEWAAFGEGQHAEHASPGNPFIVAATPMWIWHSGSAVGVGFLAAQDPEQSSHDKGHEDGAPGHGCHDKRDPALKKGGQACASAGTCKTCEAPMDENGQPTDGPPVVRETTKCSSWCHVRCCHCLNPCDS